MTSDFPTSLASEALFVEEDMPIALDKAEKKDFIFFFKAENYGIPGMYTLILSFEILFFKAANPDNRMFHAQLFVTWVICW